ncbi:MAG: class II aldolase/adducin family protein [Porticoccaceae bacterium]|nr:class II aldolase/adducin family protein [Porticoccaceae bacterium]
MDQLNAKKINAAQIKLRIAARALGRAGLVHAFGHCSMRLSEDTFLVCAPEPLATIRPNEPGTLVKVSGSLPEGVLGEVRIHQQIYARNPAAGAVCRIMPANVMTLSTFRATAKPRHGLAAYFGASTPLWDDPRLLRNDEAAIKLSEQMGDSPAIVMRGNGAVVTGETLEQAVAYSWFLEDAARVEIQARNLGVKDADGLLSDQEIVDRQVMTGRVFERMWRYLTDGDEELQALAEYCLLEKVDI